MLNFMFLGANGSVQELQSGNTSLLVCGENGSVAVDLSCNIAAILSADVDAVILTHEHIDHVYALPSLLHQLWLTGRTVPLDLYIPPEIRKLVDGLIDLFSIRDKKNIFEIRIHTDSAFRTGSLQVTMFSTDHTDASVGIIIEDGRDKLVYTSDTRPITQIPPVMYGAQILIHEASGLLEEKEILVRKGHSCGVDAGTLAARLGVEQLFLCHLPADQEKKYKILKEAKNVFPEAYLPEILKYIRAGRAEET